MRDKSFCSEGFQFRWLKINEIHADFPIVSGEVNFITDLVLENIYIDYNNLIYFRIVERRRFD